MAAPRPCVERNIMALQAGILIGDSRELLRGIPDQTFQMCVTSPPYWGLRDYGIPGQIGAEGTIEAYCESMTAIFREVRRTLRDDGTLWLNLGDSYTSGGRGWRDVDDRNAARGMGYRAPTPAGLKAKDLIGVPWRVAFALQADGWYLRTDIIWHKPNGQPESVKDRPARSHEYVFLLAKNERYFYDAEAMKEPTADGKGTRARRSVWSLNTEPYAGAHFAAFPPDLARLCIMGGSRAGDLVLDPFLGSGTTGMVALQEGRGFTGMELNGEYADLARERIAGINPGSQSCVQQSVR
jgi:site-specific DNA-methyltransferase (adenine-specific)/site-specific DNA-methyltransferase (cytosine-N4-specific)